MNVSIIIVNYNTKQLLSDCIDSIYRQTIGVDFEIIVVDNASTDESEVYICHRFPDIKWISSGENLGFGRANNLGVQYAKGEYLFLLNSDTVLCNNAVGIFYEYAQIHKNEKIGVLGVRLLDDKLRPNKSYGNFPSPKNEIYYLLGKLGIKNNMNILKNKDIDYVIGADMFIRKSIFKYFGGFDPKIFMYYEETDLQYRMANKGLIRRIIEGPQIIHLEGGSFGSQGLTLNRFIMAQKSYNYYLKKHYTGFKYILYKMMVCLVRLSLFFTTDWSIKDKFKAYKIVL